MCGIVALLSSHDAIDPQALERATRTLHHRGPDGQRHWIAPHRRVGLGHARLSIIDLHTGDQPIANEDERLHIVVNGEFYDYERVQRELEHARPSSAHAVGQRDRSAPVRGLRHAVPAPAARRVRLRPLGRAQPDALRGARPLRHQAALLRAARRRAGARLRGQGAVRRRRAGALESDRRSCRPRACWCPSRTRRCSTAFNRCRPATTCSRRASGVRIVRYWDFDYPRADTARAAVRCRVRRGVPPRARRGGPHPPARRRAGGLLPERRDRFVRRAGPGGAASQRSDPRLHADLRPRRLRRERHRARDGRARRRRVPSDPDPAGRSRRQLRRRDLAQRDDVHQRARRRQVRAQPGGARCRLQGRAHRRRLRRDPRRLPALPPRHAAVRQRGPGSGDRRRGCSTS